MKQAPRSLFLTGLGCVFLLALASWVGVYGIARAGEVSQAFDSGTFTPTIAGVSTAGTASYTLQIGRYARYGNRVFVSVDLTYTGGTGTGQGSIAGLPFAARAVTSSDHVCSILMSNYTYGGVQVAAGITNGESVIKFWGLTSAGAIGTVAYDGAASVWVSCTYEVAP